MREGAMIKTDVNPEVNPPFFIPTVKANHKFFRLRELVPMTKIDLF